MTARMIPVAPFEREDFTRMAVQHFSELNRSFVPAEDWREHYFPSILSNPDFFLRWILGDEAKAGFILFGLEKHRFLPRKIGAIYELYVSPEFRRRGLGKAIAREAIRELWTHSPSKVQLEVIEGRTEAAELWSSLGFKKVTARYVLSEGRP